MKTPIIVVHAAQLNPHYPANTLRGIVDSAKKGFKYIEIDIICNKNGAFFVFHNEQFDRVTNRKGNVFNINKPQVSHLWYVNEKHQLTAPVSPLEDVVKLIKKTKSIEEVQLDFKMYPSTLITERILERLLETINPVKEKIRITSYADWVITKLRELDSDIKLGFDPQLYIDYRGKDKTEYPPFKSNRFGYRDDHPLSLQNWDTPSRYLHARAVSLWKQGAVSDVWFMNHIFLIKSFQDGFNWVDFLHNRGIKVCAWTINMKREGEEKSLETLLRIGVDRITTNTPLMIN